MPVKYGQSSYSTVEAGQKTWGLSSTKPCFSIEVLLEIPGIQALRLRMEGKPMRMLMHVKIPNEPFNSLVRKGAAGGEIREVLQTIKPEHDKKKADSGPSGILWDASKRK